MLNLKIATKNEIHSKTGRFYFAVKINENLGGLKDSPKATTCCVPQSKQY